MTNEMAPKARASAGGAPASGSPMSGETRAALRALAARSGPAAETGVAEQVAIDARRREITAEHMIVDLKRAWSTLPEVRDLGRGAEARALLDRLITRCINAFYDRR